jgi:hypothetical protein
LLCGAQGALRASPGAGRSLSALSSVQGKENRKGEIRLNRIQRKKKTGSSSRETLSLLPRLSATLFLFAPGPDRIQRRETSVRFIFFVFFWLSFLTPIAPQNETRRRPRPRLPISTMSTPLPTLASASGSFQPNAGMAAARSFIPPESPFMSQQQQGDAPTDWPGVGLNFFGPGPEHGPVGTDPLSRLYAQLDNIAAQQERLLAALLPQQPQEQQQQQQQQQPQEEEEDPKVREKSKLKNNKDWKAAKAFIRDAIYSLIHQDPYWRVPDDDEGNWEKVQREVQHVFPELRISWDAISTAGKDSIRRLISAIHGQGKTSMVTSHYQGQLDRLADLNKKRRGNQEYIGKDKLDKLHCLAVSKIKKKQFRPECYKSFDSCKHKAAWITYAARAASVGRDFSADEVADGMKKWYPKDFPGEPANQEQQGQGAGQS